MLTRRREGDKDNELWRHVLPLGEGEFFLTRRREGAKKKDKGNT